MTLSSPHMLSVQIATKSEDKTTETFLANESFVLFLLPLILWFKWKKKTTTTTTTNKQIKATNIFVFQSVVDISISLSNKPTVFKFSQN